MPSTELRKTVLTAARRIVVKLGTQLLTSKDARTPGLDIPFMTDFARQVVDLRNAGYEITLVSSGAIGAGCTELGLKQRPKDVAMQQAVAAVGQRRLMTTYYEVFGKFDVHVAQLLLTRSDFDDRVRFLNFRNCITQVHNLGCVPIINENDSVAVDEIRFGDNDQLGSLVCHALRADAMLLLTVVDGLLDGEGRRIDLVRNMDEARSLTRTEKSALGTGGMQSKLESARVVAQSGEIAVIANGREPEVLRRILSGEYVGTVFLPRQRKLDSRKRWIGLTTRPAGSITIDDGAVRAVRQQGKSLLASGIRKVSGTFGRGAVLSVCDEAGTEVARGLTNYSAEELTLIMGKKSSQFEKLLGRQAFAEAIHRDNLVLDED